MTAEKCPPRERWSGARRSSYERRRRARLANRLEPGALLIDDPSRRPIVVRTFTESARHELCARYAACLDDASHAQDDGRIDPAECSWSCAEDCPGRKTIEPLPRVLTRSDPPVLPSRLERWR